MLTFTVQESVTINRPIQAVFTFIADAENDLRWCPAVKEIEQIAGDGPGLGARYRMVHTPGGMKFHATVEIVAYEPPRLMKWVMTDGGHRLHGTYQLEAVHGGTRLTQTSQITFAGWLRIPGLFMKRVIAREVQKELGKQFANLKQLMEGEPMKLESQLLEGATHFQSASHLGEKPVSQPQQPRMEVS
jgi:uncharacterized protein YndB with AHSA1/START domain